MDPKPTGKGEKPLKSPPTRCKAVGAMDCENGNKGWAFMHLTIKPSHLTIKPETRSLTIKPPKFNQFIQLYICFQLIFFYTMIKSVVHRWSKRLAKLYIFI